MITETMNIKESLYQSYSEYLIETIEKLTKDIHDGVERNKGEYLREIRNEKIDKILNEST